MRQLEDDLNFISSLPDRPAMATADLKREFDKAGNRIKTYINSIMLPDLVDFQTNIETTISTQIGELRTELEEDMTTLQTTLEGQMTDLSTNLNSAMNQLRSNVESSIGGKVSSGDFVITQHTQGVEPSYGYNYETRSTTATNSGYKALGCVGWTIAQDIGNIRVDGVRTTAIGNGTCTIELKTFGNTSGRNHGTFTLSILWVKQ